MYASRFSENLYFIGSFENERATTIANFAQRCPVKTVCATTVSNQKGLNAQLHRAGFRPFTTGNRLIGHDQSHHIILWRRVQKLLKRPGSREKSKETAFGAQELWGPHNTFCCGLRATPATARITHTGRSGTEHKLEDWTVVGAKVRKSRRK